MLCSPVVVENFAINFTWPTSDSFVLFAHLVGERGESVWFGESSPGRRERWSTQLAEAAQDYGQTLVTQLREFAVNLDFDAVVEAITSPEFAFYPVAA